jgi:hypothetical protein
MPLGTDPAGVASTKGSRRSLACLDAPSPAPSRSPLTLVGSTFDGPFKALLLRIKTDEISRLLSKRSPRRSPPHRKHHIR